MTLIDLFPFLSTIIKICLILGAIAIILMQFIASITFDPDSGVPSEAGHAILSSLTSAFGAVIILLGLATLITIIIVLISY